MSSETERESDTRVRNEERNLSANGGTESRSLREIIYLDLERLSSYLSQLEGGLEEYRQTFEGRGDAETSQGWKMGLGGALPLQFNWNTGNTAGVDATFAIEQKRRHHAALEVLENALEERLLIGDLDAGRAFIKHTDYAMLLDYETLTRFFRRFTSILYSAQFVGENESLQNLRKEAEKAGKKQLADFDNKIKIARSQVTAEHKKQQEYYDHFANVFDEYQDQVDVVFPNVDLIGTLERQAMLVSADRFRTVYGTPTRKRVSVIGLDTEGAPQTKKFTAPNDMVEPGGLTYAAAFMMQAFNDNVGANLSGSGMRPIIPIALYIDLEQENSPPS